MAVRMPMPSRDGHNRVHQSEQRQYNAYSDRREVDSGVTQGVFLWRESVGAAKQQNQHDDQKNNDHRDGRDQQGPEIILRRRRWGRGTLSQPAIRQTAAVNDVGQLIKPAAAAGRAGFVLEERFRSLGCASGSLLCGTFGRDGLNGSAELASTYRAREGVVDV